MRTSADTIISATARDAPILALATPSS